MKRKIYYFAPTYQRAKFYFQSLWNDLMTRNIDHYVDVKRMALELPTLEMQIDVRGENRERGIYPGQIYYHYDDFMETVNQALKEGGKFEKRDF